MSQVSIRSRVMIAAVVTATVTGCVLSGILPAGLFSAGVADAEVPAALPPTVSADGLPTAQMNGVAWSQVVVGNTVYVAGKFTTARPAGAAAGTQEVARNNVLAYDIRTGVLNTSFAPSLNAQALVITASPDGTRIYVGGDFTSVNGTTRNRVAALDSTTGALIGGFAPSVGSQVRALAATDSTVYLGGNFNTVGGKSRARLAAVSAATGALLPWNPTLQTGPTDGNHDGGKTAEQNAQTSTEVLSLIVTDNGAQVVAAGRFNGLNDVKATGVGALDAATGATLPFAVNQQITNQGVVSAVYSLSTDGTNVYGTAYDFAGPGNLEGSFAATVKGGVPVWFNTCRGDTYSSFATGGVLYMSSHAHDCGSIGGFPEQSPRINKFATAVSLTATGTSTGTLSGQPSPTLLSWFPSLTAGTVTGQSQADWSVTGNSQYVVMAGEFPKVNGVAQQGLVRFAVRSIAPNKIAPVYDAAMKPTPLAISAGSVRLTWPATWDQDDHTLTYDVYRSDKPNTIVGTVTADSQWWDRPTVGFVDRTAAPGATYTYKVNVKDAAGNQYRSGNSTAVTVSADMTAAGFYADTVAADQPSHFWRLSEAGGSPVSYDQGGFDDLSLNSGVTLGSAGALKGTANTAAGFSGDSTGFGTTTTPVVGPQVFSLEAWFQTTSTSGGRIIGFGNSSTGNSNDYDRHIYLDDAGHVTMGVYDGYIQTVTTPGSYNDGSWHHVVGSYGNGTVSLYLDGMLIGTRTGVNGAQVYSGYWRVGGDSSWGGSSRYLAGRIDDVAVYPTVLSAERIREHTSAGTTGTSYNAPPVAAFGSTADGLVVAFDGSQSSDSDGTVSGYSWDFGDGSTSTAVSPKHTYAAAGTYRVTLTVTDNRSATASVTNVIQVLTSGTAGSAYSRAVLADTPDHFWRLGQPSGNVPDMSGTADLTVNSGVTPGAAGAIAGDADTASAFDGSGSAATQTPVEGPTTFSIEAWFKTTTTDGGRIVGFGNASSGNSSNYDRHVYMDQSGRVYFGVWPGSIQTVQSAVGLNDGRWHQVIGTIGSGGMVLYVDGARVDQNPNTGSQGYQGYWRVGGDSTWAGTQYFSGVIDDVAIYPAPLTATQVTNHWRLGQASANNAPTASFTSVISDLAGAFDATASADSDGTVASYAWAFGDGGTATGATAAHTFTAAGTYQVALTVTDDKGATGTVTRPVTVTAAAPVNAAPTAAFTSSATDLAVAVDGSSSTDRDGTVASYAWAFGDGGTATGATAAHTFTAAGTYQVALTVTDDKGATGSVTRAVTVTAPAATPVLASDGFTRTVTGGLGTADVGGAWTVSAGGSRQSVAPGAATFALAPGASPGSYLGSVSQSAVSVQTSLSLSAVPVGGPASIYVVGRRVDTNQEYRARLRVLTNGTVGVAVTRLAGTASETMIGSEVVVPGLTVAPGSPLQVRVDVSGSTTTTVAVTVWGSGQQPATPTVSRTDTTASLQGPGGVGLSAYLSAAATSSVSVQVTSFSARALG